MKPKVVFAIQSPTLVNILAKSDQWDLQVCDMGDTNFKEAQSLVDTKKWDGDWLDVHSVYVCSPAHYEFATQHFKNSKIVWVLHSGLTHLIPENLKPRYALNFQYSNVVSWALARPEMEIRTVIPHYQPDPCGWQWKPNDLWTMQSRPETRLPEAGMNIARVFEASPYVTKHHRFFGENQRGGFLDPVAREDRFRHCSAYLTCLHRRSGFGLAQHEALSKGTPLVGLSWADMSSKKLLGLHDTIEQTTLAAERVMLDRRYAEAVSKSGLEFIALERSKARMDESIKELLETI